MSDPVNKPTHYNQGGIECIQAIEAAVTGLAAKPAYLAGNIIKYVWRHSYKGKAVQDLKKARWYLDRLINYYEEKENEVLAVSEDGVKNSTRPESRRQVPECRPWASGRER